ncbi:MAG: replication initiator protein A [Armatimonadetes bacterium]|nr:replication initiator protein A [Armatimonadota bacterium]
MKNDPSKPEMPQGAFFLIVDDHSGRDEMNLAGNPFALLQTAGKSKSSESYIKYEWERRLPNGKTTLASWEVSGHAELGLPGPSDELLYLVLLEMTREAAVDGVWPQQVHFSRAALLKRLGWPDTKQYYTLLSDCFARLDATVIQARHSFYDATQKMPLAFISFSILDGAQISDEPRGRKAQGALPLSFFKWSDRMHASFNAGNVRSLALDFIMSLEAPTARRLFRYLDMHRNAQKPALHEYKIGLAKLRDHLGMVGIKYLSVVRQRLEPAHTELIARGYLAGVEYRKGASSEMAVYTFADAIKPLKVAPTPAKTPVLAAPRLFEAPLEPEPQIYPQEAFEVFSALPEAEKTRLRDLARRDIEPAFWDRLERPDSPMALVLWEIVQREHAEKFA